MECDIPYKQWPNNGILDEYIGTKKQFHSYVSDPEHEPPFGTYEYMESLCNINPHHADKVDVTFRIIVNIPTAVSNQFLWQLQKNGWRLNSNQITGEPYREFDLSKVVTVQSMKLRYELQERELRRKEKEDGKYRD